MEEESIAKTEPQDERNIVEYEESASVKSADDRFDEYSDKKSENQDEEVKEG